MDKIASVEPVRRMGYSFDTFGPNGKPVIGFCPGYGGWVIRHASGAAEFRMTDPNA
jgi:hypothetical protein